jgi:hypothetical protein
VRIIGTSTAVLAGNSISRITITWWRSRRKKVEVVASEARKVTHKIVKDGMIKSGWGGDIHSLK